MENGLSTLELSLIELEKNVDAAQGDRGNRAP